MHFIFFDPVCLKQKHYLDHTLGDIFSVAVCLCYKNESKSKSNQLMNTSFQHNISEVNINIPVHWHSDQALFVFKLFNKVFFTFFQIL